MGRNPSYGLSPVSSGGQWTETARTNIDTVSTSDVTFQSAFTAGQLYRIRGYNIAASTANVTLNARMMDGGSELSTASYAYETDGRGINESTLAGVTVGASSSANDLWRLTGFTATGDGLIERSSRDMLGLCFELYLMIGPTPTTDDVAVSLTGHIWGGGYDTSGVTDMITSFEYVAAVYLPRTTPPDGIKFYILSDSLDFETGAYIAYDTIDSAFV